MKYATERDRLVALLSVPIHPKVGADPAEVLADYLLDNGIIVPLCEPGSKVYTIANFPTRHAAEWTVSSAHSIYMSAENESGAYVLFRENELGTSIWATKEDAEAAIAGKR